MAESTRVELPLSLGRGWRQVKLYLIQMLAIVFLDCTRWLCFCSKTKYEVCFYLGGMNGFS